jgi:lycopene beta-cyclase
MSRPLIILGGGLWGSLLAYRLQTQRPELDFILYEKGSTLGGNHTWSFYGSDMAVADQQWLKPFISQSWSGYSVAFPQYQRQLSVSYHAISSSQLHEVLIKTIPAQRLRLASCISLAEAQALSALVLDARGETAAMTCGYQKFLGFDLKLERPHGMEQPLIMDARVAQKDGFRFMYYLPWTQDTLLVEDTRYSSTPELDELQLESDLLEEVARRGLVVERVLRRETGCLPIPLEPIHHAQQAGVVKLAGIFHDTTGYSLPYAVKVINQLVQLQEFNASSAAQAVEKLRQSFEPNRHFFRMLNLLLFKSSAPEQRYRMLEFFYRRPEPLINRFYGGELSGWDKLKFFMGKPPVSAVAAMRVLLKGGT